MALVVTGEAIMETFTLEGTPRESRGKGPARRLRVTGMVPATLYGGKKEAISLAVNAKHVSAILRSATGHNTIITVKTQDGRGFRDREGISSRPRQGHAAPRGPAACRHGRAHARQGSGAHVRRGQGVKLQGGVFEWSDAKSKSSACRRTFPNNSTWIFPN